MPTTALPLEIVVVRGEEGAELVRQFHSRYIETTFAGNEVEDVSLWMDRLEDATKRAKLARQQPSKSSAHSFDTAFEFVVAVAVSNENGERKVVGGASCELYLASGCGLVTYVVVDAALRGQGYARKLFDACYAACEDLSLDAPFAGMFIEVLQKRDTCEIAKAAAGANTNKAAIFSSLGFLPLDGDLVHPGRMKGHRYTLGFLSKSLRISTRDAASSEEPLCVPWDVVRTFVAQLFYGILADEGKTGEAATEEVQGLLLAYQRSLSRTQIAASPEFWL